MEIDRAVCLLLDKRLVDNGVRVTNMFAAHGIDVQLFICGDGQTLPAHMYSRIDSEPPKNRHGYSAWVARPNSWNAFMCYRQIIEVAKADGVRHLLLIEDDAELTDDFEKVSKGAWAQMNLVDPNWDMLYLGANHTFRPTKEVGPNLLRINGSGCWHSVILRHTVFDAILALQPDRPIDGACGDLIHPKHRCYAAWPNVSIPRPGYSYCEGGQVDYRHYFKNKGC